jgi:DNA-binding NtrC family response regulator
MSLGRIDVLVVEDNLDDFEILHASLNERGSHRLRLTHVERLGTALERVQDADFDVVLLDLGLPDGTGLENLTRFTAAAPEVPVVIMTGTDDEELALTAVRRGAQDYLVKGNVDADLVLHSVRHAIERNKMLREIVSLQQRLLKAERDRVVGECAGAAAHEILQPLTAMLGVTEILLSRATPDDPLRSQYEVLLRSAKRVETIVRKMGEVREYTTKPYDQSMIVDFHRETSEAR